MAFLHCFLGVTGIGHAIRVNFIIFNQFPILLSFEPPNTDKFFWSHTNRTKFERLWKLMQISFSIIWIIYCSLPTILSLCWMWSEISSVDLQSKWQFMWCHCWCHWQPNTHTHTGSDTLKRIVNFQSILVDNITDKKAVKRTPSSANQREK